jgi:hypothetical protein
LIAELHGEPVSTRLDAWRPADQHYYVSDTTKFSEATGWRPETSARDGITKLYRWLEESDIALFRTAPGHDRGRISAVRTVAVHPARTSASAIPST